MADISKITLPNGDEYNIKDASAREELDNLNKFYLTDTTPTSASSGDLWFIIEEEE